MEVCPSGAFVVVRGTVCRTDLERRRPGVAEEATGSLKAVAAESFGEIAIITTEGGGEEGEIGGQTLAREFPVCVWLRSATALDRRQAEQDADADDTSRTDEEALASAGGDEG